mmetsp:Transcript_46475/g.105492  ORF Transcript_46475/g.105492 Transcript_46475/m.105492 type:complete len:345 (+) Transcript_46475:54-1088(+)
MRGAASFHRAASRHGSRLPSNGSNPASQGAPEPARDRGRSGSVGSTGAAAAARQAAEPRGQRPKFLSQASVISGMRSGSRRPTGPWGEPVSGLSSRLGSKGDLSRGTGTRAFSQGSQSVVGPKARGEPQSEPPSAQPSAHPSVVGSRVGPKRSGAIGRALTMKVLARREAETQPGAPKKVGHRVAFRHNEEPWVIPHGSLGPLDEQDFAVEKAWVATWAYSGRQHGSIMRYDLGKLMRTGAAATAPSRGTVWTMGAGITREICFWNIVGYLIAVITYASLSKEKMNPTAAFEFCNYMNQFVPLLLAFFFGPQPGPMVGIEGPRVGGCNASERQHCNAALCPFSE